MRLTILPSLRFATRILHVLCPSCRRIMHFPSDSTWMFSQRLIHPDTTFHTWGWSIELSRTMYKRSPCLLCRRRQHTASTCDLCPHVKGDSDAFYSAIITTAEPLQPFPADGITAQDTQSWFWTPFYQAIFNYNGPTKQSWHGFLRAAAQHPLPQLHHLDVSALLLRILLFFSLANNREVLLQE